MERKTGATPIIVIPLFYNASHLFVKKQVTN
jgi:hypothetical protein